LNGSLVPPDEMSGSTDPDEGFERLLRGALPEDPEEQQLGAFVEDVRTAFPAAPVLAEESHLAAIGAAARLLAREGGPVIEGSDGQRRARIPGKRRLNVRVPIFRSLAAKIVAGLAVLMWSFGGLAVAGALPGGIEDVVSNAADEVLVNLSGDDVDDGDVDDVEDEADDDDQGDDDQGEDESDDDEGDDDQGDDDQGEDESDDDEGEDESDDDEGEDESDDDESDDDQGDDDQGDDGQGDDSDDGDDSDEDD
jgi:hypothetical protein